MDKLDNLWILVRTRTLPAPVRLRGKSLAPSGGKTTLLRDILSLGRFVTLDDDTILAAMENDPWGQLQPLTELGLGPHRSGDVANVLNQKVTSVAPVRNSLIAKGMIFSSGHGDTAFTVPLFDEFMKRTLPGI